MARIPQYLHRQMQVLWWEADEFIIFMLGLSLWILFGGYEFLLMGLIVPIIYSKLKKRYPRGLLKHLMYFTGFKEFRGYPSFYIKKFIE